VSNRNDSFEAKDGGLYTLILFRMKVNWIDSRLIHMNGADLKHLES
jgi:hypothetical protein